MTKKDECQELKNIKYRGMLEHHNSNHMNNETTENMTSMEDFLEKEKQLNENIPWAKLDKIIKIRKLNEYVDDYIKAENIQENEKNSMRLFLRECLDKKQLSRVKEVLYDKEKGIILSIPSLIFNKSSNKFTLKQSDKRSGTSNCLAPKKPRKTRKVDCNIVTDVN